MSYREIPPKQIRGNGLHLGKCMICGDPFYRQTRFGDEAVICNLPACRFALRRIRKDADVSLPRYTCPRCGRAYRSEAQQMARCPDCGKLQRAMA